MNVMCLVGLSVHAQKMAHALFKGECGWVLEASVASTEQSYNRCVNVDKMCMTNTDTTVKTK